MSGLAMGDRHDYVALEWVKGEIAETLKQAQQSLEDYVEQPQGNAGLGFCLAYIHQVNGILQMVQFFGAALLAEEMELVAQSLLDKKVVNVNEALEVLMQAIIQLPRYLERIQAARRDLPMAVLPLLNDLRAARGEKFLSQSSLFNPALPPALPAMDPERLVQLAGPQLGALLRKIRQTMQVALIGLLRDQWSGQSLTQLARVFAGLERLSQGTPILPLWQAASGLTDGLANRSLDLSTTVRTLLRKLDSQLRELALEGVQGLDRQAPEELLKDILFYVAKAQPNSARLQRLHQTYQLADALPAEALDDGTADRDAIRSVVSALCEELVRVKDSLDLFVRSDRLSLGDLDSLQLPLKQIADTLAVLGFAQQRKVVLEQAEMLQEIASGARAASDANLMDIAGALLYLEATLIGMVGTGETAHTAEMMAPTDVAQVHRLVIREARAGLEQAKDGIIEFIASQWQHQHLEPVSALLNQVRGGLAMIPLSRAAQLIDSTRRYIDEQLLASATVPGWQDLDTLADAITSVDYYLERLYEDQIGDSELVLDTAAQSMAALGYPLLETDEPQLRGELPAEEPDRPDALGELDWLLDQDVSAPQGDATELFLLTDAPLPEDFVDGDCGLVHEALQGALDEAVIPLLFDNLDVAGEQLTIASEAAGEVLDELSFDSFELPEVELPEEAAPSGGEQPAAQEQPASLVSTSPLNPPATEVVEHLLPPPADEEPVDEELQDVFVEEAGEVLETLAEFFPQWQQDLADGQALTEVRRAFHTLKGSGRMVRALVVGELAWAIENMLNRVIEGSIAPSAELLQVIADVIALLPELVEEYAGQQQRQRDDVDRLAAVAHALARQQPLPVFADAVDVAVLPADEGIEAEAAVADGLEGTETAALDPVLLEIFYSEAKAHLQALQDFIRDCQEFLPRSVSEELQRAMHTLKGSAHMAGITPVAALATASERLVKEYRAHLFNIDEPEAALLTRSAELLEQGLEQLDSTPLRPLPGAAGLVEELNGLLEQRLSCEQQSGSNATDPLLISRFLADGMDLLLDMDDHLQRWRNQPGEHGQLLELIDELTTLKKGARMAELEPIEALADALLGFYQQVNAGRQELGEQQFGQVTQAHDALINMMDEVAAGLDVTAQPQLVASLLQLVEAELPAEAGKPADALEPAVMQDAPAAGFTAYAGLDPDMVEIFLDEALELMDSANQNLDQWLAATDNKVCLGALMRDLHTLKGGARMAEIVPVGDLAHELESVYEYLLDGRQLAEQSLGNVLHSAHDRLAELLEQLQAAQDVWSPLETIERLQALRRGEAVLPVADSDAPATTAVAAAGQDASSGTAAPLRLVAGEPDELVDIFLEEAFEVLEHMGASLQDWVSGSDNPAHVESLQRDLHTLKGGARMAEIAAVADLAHELEFLYEDLAGGRLQPCDELGSFLYQVHDQLNAMLEAVRDGRPLIPAASMLEMVRFWRSGEPGSVAPMTAVAADEETLLAAEPELREEFIQEALEFYQRFPQAASATDEAAHSLLASLKGAAGLAGLPAIIRLCDRLQDSLQDEDQAGWTQQLEGLGVQIGQLQQAQPQTIGNTQPLPVPALAAAAGSSAATEAGIDSGRAGQLARQALPFMRKSGRSGQSRSQQQGTQEMVRIPAELLEELVNLAGETSIFRGRVEQQVSDFGYTLNEMETTLDRIRDQLRRLDTETQAQILSRLQTEGEGASYAEFDPLEMDRHSQLQQLSRSLFESASDLLDLKETLSAKSRDAETLLLQQARVNTELQEGLMRTRMVPFERLVPRLRRIVRHVSAELGKQAELLVTNAEGEMDRSVMERMVAPLEHMLRNAVGHGLEAPDVRRDSGKPETGRIRLQLGREGADILLTMSDDGAGIDIAAVRAKAIERGLMGEHSGLGDQEIMQFILHAGFSTAKEVTQVSGRGVGMDVVSSEIKQLGGSINIESESGGGTRFVIRLPFTVSVNRALMVTTGEDLYAIPLNTIEGIVRVSPYELEALYGQARRGEPASYEYAGQKYDLKYLGELLVNGQQPKLVGQTLPLPVVLVRSSEHAVAIQVDSLAGSREIVVKSLGPQFASVPSLSGATILGDGRVVVILDLLAAIRNRYALPGEPDEGARQHAQPRKAVTGTSRILHVMVVDDSVTVRKVTSRLLERYGMHVTTAKDGVDAINQLQERRPDIMLLDIEMPRMDGFEVATLVRHDERLHDLPIIMITSRTGDKHRERALRIGVNEYFGKPYQEAQLLGSIRQLTGLDD